MKANLSWIGMLVAVVFSSAMSSCAPPESPKPTVTVSQVAVTGVTLDQATLTLVAGGASGSLAATIAPAGATDTNCTWSSNNESVATVNALGVVIPKTTGNAVITVTTHDGSKTATCTVTVVASAVVVTGVSLDQTSLTLVAGGATGTLAATIAPALATDSNRTWASNNESVATVNASGVVTPKALGSAVITVTTHDGAKTANCTVTVVGAAVPVTGVTLDQATLTLVAGGATGSLSATIAPAGATDSNRTWASNNESVATVNASGVVTPKAVGSAVITVTTHNGGKTANCIVTVVGAAVPVTSVTIDQTTLTLVASGATGSLSATIAPAGATDTNRTWASNNESVASVNALGVVTPKAAGTAVITVTTHDGSKTAACTVTVVTAVTGVTLDQATLSLVAGSATGALVATIAPASATDTAITWSSGNEAVATVNTLGIVTPKAAGTAVITVTTHDGSRTATCTVTVVTAVSGVTLDKTTLSLVAGGATGSVAATITPTGATDNSCTWASNNEAVATVNASGVVTPKSAGTAVITVTTHDGSKTATCTVTVVTAVTGVTLDKVTLSLVAGGATGALVGTVAPANATDTATTWSSGNEAVATVNTLGVVTPQAAGTAVITVTTHDGARTATCTVTVVTAVSGVTLDQTTLSLVAGGATGSLAATIAPAGATDTNRTWSSSNESVATVNAFGVVTPKAAGTSVVTVTTHDGSKTATCTVTVVPDTGSFSLTFQLGTFQSLLFTPGAGLVPSRGTLTLSPGNATLASSGTDWRWYLDGAKDSTQTGPTFIFSASGRQPGTYAITVTVGYQGVRYSGTFTATVQD